MYCIQSICIVKQSNNKGYIGKKCPTQYHTHTHTHVIFHKWYQTIYWKTVLKINNKNNNNNNRQLLSPGYVSGRHHAGPLIWPSLF